MRLYEIFIQILGIVLLLPVFGFSATINVPGDSATIKAGINGAVNGDTVLVAPGTYTENISFNGKAIVLISSGGRDVTIIESAASEVTVVAFNNSEDSSSVLDGFTIDGASVSPGIHCDGSSPIIQNCDVSFCYGGEDLVGIFCNNSAAKVRHNLVHQNQGTVNGAGIVGKGSQALEVSYNEVFDNTALQGPGIGLFANGSNMKIHHNLVWGNNGSTGWSGGIQIYGTNCEIINNTIVGNTQGITILDGSDIAILNNIVVSNQNEGIIPGAAIIDYNDIWDNGSANDPGINGISLYPLFVDDVNNDYTLRSLSPCIDSGDPDSQFNDPDGTRNDMGALPLGGFQPNFPIALNINISSEPQWHVLNHTPTFYWSFYDTTRGQVAYEIEIGTNEDWLAAEMWATGEVYSADTFAVYAGLTLEDGATYYYRIRVNNGSIWGDWQYRAFRMNSVPSAPIPIYPVSQEPVNYQRVRLIVENSINLENDTLTYDFEIYSDPGLTTIEASQNNVPEGVDSTSSGYFEGFLIDTEYWWRSRSYDGYEYSLWGLTGSFIIPAQDTIRIPLDQPTIQSGINIAENGDIVLVSPGEYHGTVNYLGKVLLVKSTDGPVYTTITTNNDENLVTFENGEDEDAILEGFTLKGGWIGVACENSGPTIKNNILIGQNVDDWAAISLGGPGYPSYPTTGPSPAKIINNTIIGCVTGAIFAFSTVPPNIRNNIIAYNGTFGVENDGVQPILNYNNVFGHQENYLDITDPGDGSISIDPMLADDLSPLAGSPCIDAGDPSAEYNDPDSSRGDIGAVPYNGSVLHDPKTIYVPSDYPSIKLAVVFAVDNDTIVVAPGDYYEVINMMGKDVLLTSEAGPELTHILYPRQVRGSVGWTEIDLNQISKEGIVGYENKSESRYIELSIIQTDNCSSSATISGITFDGGFTAKAIYGFNSRVSINDCIFEKCYGAYGAAMKFVESAPNIENNIFRYNFGSWRAGAIFIKPPVLSDTCVIKNNLFYSNSADEAPCIYVYGGHNVLISKNTFYNNFAPYYATRKAAIYIDYNAAYIDIINNTLCRNLRGISIGESDFIDVRNNLVICNYMGGLKDRSSYYSYYNLTYDYNLIWNNNDSDYVTSDTGINDINSDPYLMQGYANLFIPTDSSPCINAGDPSPEYNDPDGTRNDIGATPLSEYVPYFPTVINVPADYATIQGAIDAAHGLDTILVAPGTYIETLRFSGKELVVKSTGGPQSTVITNSYDKMLSVFEHGESEKAVLEGFTFKGGWMAICICNSGPTIRRNIFDHQYITNWATISIGNVGYYVGYGYLIGPCPALIENNTFVYGRNGAISSYSSLSPTIKNNIIAFNDKYGLSGPGDFPGAGELNLSYNNLYGNPVNYYEIIDTGTGTISEHPLLSYDFEPLVGSPCIDAGDPDSSYNDPDSSRNDMGAVPYSGGFVPHDPMILNVPAQYPTIQAGIDAAVDDDTVLVAPGKYSEMVDFLGKNIRLLSESGAEQTIIEFPKVDIDPSMKFGSGSLEKSREGYGFDRSPAVITLYFDQYFEVEIKGFTIRGNFRGRGIMADSMYAEVSECIIENCRVRFADGGGMYFYWCKPNIHDNIFRNNITPGTGGGLYLVLGDYDGYAYIRNNIFYGNSAFKGGAIATLNGQHAYIENNFIFGNRSTTNNGISHGAIYFYADSVYVLNNTIDGNSMGITVKSSKSCDIKNNIISNNIHGGIEATGDVTLVRNPYNLVWNNKAGDFIDMHANVPTLYENPLIEPSMYEEFYLQAGSPCIDAGDPNPVYNDPDGSRADIGARPYSDYTPREPQHYTVPSSYPTIQDAVNASYSGDIISVAPGTYEEFINFGGRSLILTSLAGESQTTIISPFMQFYDGLPPNNNNVTGQNKSKIIYAENIPSVVNLSFTDANSRFEGFTVDGNNEVQGINGFGCYAHIYQNRIKNCRGIWDGSGIFIAHGAPLIENNKIHDNICPANGAGILIFLGYDYGLAQIKRNEIYSNMADNAPGISLIQGDDALVERNVLYSNTLNSGSSFDIPGALYCNAEKINLINNTVAYNVIGISLYGCADIDIRNNNITNNSSAGLVFYTDDPDIYHDYNNIWNNGYDYFGTDSAANEISDYPNYINPSENNFHINDRSPCINAGDPYPIYNDPDGSRNDIGAYWYNYGFICGDANNDYLVNIFDVTYVISYLYMSGSPPDPMESADVNNDSSVNIFDITYLISYLYLEGPEPECP